MRSNRLLSLIPESEKRLLLAISEKVELRPRQVLHHWRLPTDSMYFIESGLVSVSTKVDENRFIEVWLIGSEGLVNASLILSGGERELPHRRVVEVGGVALRVRAHEFCELLEDLPVLHAVVLRYLYLVLLETSQFGACNALHALKQRLGRWLLVARAALGSDEVPLTQSALGNLLGVRRASIAECLEVLEREKIVRNRRCVIVIHDVAKLRQISCTCFNQMEREYYRQMTRLSGLGPKGGSLRLEQASAAERE